MTLFGPAPAAPPPRPVVAPALGSPITPGLGSAAAPAGPASAPPAFERRARLRNERHGLVSELARRDGTTQREVNAWVNRSLGIDSVQKATLPQLERSVELLLNRLRRR
jgi:hypothetical protein